MGKKKHFENLFFCDRSNAYGIGAKIVAGRRFHSLLVINNIYYYLFIIFFTLKKGYTPETSVLIDKFDTLR